MNKYTKAMPHVRASALYKSLCAVFRKQDHDELLRQLVWAYVDYKFHGKELDLNIDMLTDAFAWSCTPQGHGFWYSVQSAICDYEATP